MEPSSLHGATLAIPRGVTGVERAATVSTPAIPMPLNGGRA
jgi:hypothetical protein